MEAPIENSRSGRSIEDRFWENVQKTEACWLWTGSIGNHGYGQIGRGMRHGGNLLAHRVAYELLVGPLPTEGDMVIDHLCRVRPCVNPEHMEVVTRGENVRRGLLKSECIHGHPYDETNNYVSATTGGKQCRVCAKLRERRKRQQA